MQMAATESDKILYKEVEPDPKLRSFILSYWKFEYAQSGSISKEPFRHIVFPDGCISLIFNQILSETENPPIFFGPRTSIYHINIDPGLVFVGIRFFPGAVSWLFDLKAAHLREKVVPATPFLKEITFKKLQQQICKNFSGFDLIDTLFLNLIEQKPIAIENDISNAVRIILDCAGSIKVSEIAVKIGISERQLQRKFRMHVGLTVKEFARIRRLRKSLIQLILEDANFHDVLFDSGYYDQPHFNRDFSIVAGTNPTKFMKFVRQIHHQDVKL
jgi:AraC-like DNA-binding protein